MTVNHEELQSIAYNLLRAIGEDPDRPGLKDTPRRFADAWREFIDYDQGNYETTFESVQVNQMVVVSGMKVWSICEHHLLPFWANVSIGYLTGHKVLGLSKFARITQLYAHRLQLQEQLVEQVAEEVLRLTETPNVAVLAEGEHLCMTMRGAKTSARMVSSSLRGVFREEPDARAEFLKLVEMSTRHL